MGDNTHRLHTSWWTRLEVTAFSMVVAAVLFLGVRPDWDLAVTRWLQRAAPLADFPAAVFVLLGNAEVMISAVVVAGGLWYLWGRRQSSMAFWLALGLTGASVLAVGLKYLLVHPGPPPSLQRHVFDVGVALQTPYSFPSGHTMRATVFAAVALRRAPVLVVSVVVAMMAALVYLGDHWTSDVLGGLVLGIACAVLVRSVNLE